MNSSANKHRERHYAIVRKIATDDTFIIRRDYSTADTNSFLRKMSQNR